MILGKNGVIPSLVCSQRTAAVIPLEHVAETLSSDLHVDKEQTNSLEYNT
jgi:hypothetical protein